MANSSIEVTVLLHQANDGDEHAGSHLFKLVQQQLHEMAEKKMAHEPPGATIQATVLVHDVFMQLMGAGDAVDLKDRHHFYVLAAKAMRRILIDRARSRKALKRGGPQLRRARVELDRVEQQSNDVDVLELHEALERLGELDDRQAQIVELRHFGGYSVKETAELLELSTSTVKQEFALAKAWLYRELKKV